MAGKTRLISAPQPRGGDDRHGFRQLAGSMGVISPDMSAPLSAPTERFETAVVPDTEWERTVAMREASEGIARTTQAPYSPPTQASYPAAASPMVWEPPYLATAADLSSLPERFALEIERKGERWKVTAPAVHAGLWKSGDDLPTVVAEALAVLAEMMRLDGPAPAAKRGRKTK